MLLDYHLKTDKFTHFLQDCKEAMAQWNANAEASNLGGSDDLRSSLITQPASKRGSPSSSLNMYTYKTRYVHTCTAFTSCGDPNNELFRYPNGAKYYSWWMVRPSATLSTRPTIRIQTIWILYTKNVTHLNNSGIQIQLYLLSFKLFYPVEIVVAN